MIICYCCSRSGMPAALKALEVGDMDDVVLREVPCAGSVERWEVLHAFRQGAEGVLMVGCLLENCAHHYGNEIAGRRAETLERTLVDLGLSPGKVVMVHLAEHQPHRFRQAVDAMRATMRSTSEEEK